MVAEYVTEFTVQSTKVPVRSKESFRESGVIIRGWFRDK